MGEGGYSILHMDKVQHMSTHTLNPACSCLHVRHTILGIVCMHTKIVRAPTAKRLHLKKGGLNPLLDLPLLIGGALSFFKWTCLSIIWVLTIVHIEGQGHHEQTYIRII